MTPQNLKGFLFKSVLISLAIITVAYGSAYDFDASASRIVVTQTAAINVQTLSIGCWARRTGAGESSLYSVIASKTDFSTGGFEFWEDQPAGVVWWIAYNGGTRGEWKINIPSVNVWAHVVVTYNGSSSANAPVMYVNGISQTVTENQPPSGAYVAGSNDLVWGDFNNSAGSFQGQLGECFYYDRVLAANEVKSIFSCGPKMVPRQLVGYWPFGVFGARNYTSTASLTGTPTSVSTISNGPPLRYVQGATCD